MVNIIWGTENQIANYIRSTGAEIYVWGSGVMMQICLSDWLKRERLIGQVVSCTESDSSKVGKNLILYNKKVPIVNYSNMLKGISNKKNVIIIIACSYFYQILQTLDNEAMLDKVDCLCLPMVYLENLSSGRLESRYCHGERKIPKKIHYCWFGKNKIPEKSAECIDSWKRNCPDYEIFCWNESNIDIHISPWMEIAYQRKQWAYVSDYVRAWVLYTFGGYYFDVDVELLRGLDDLSGAEGFGCFEKWPVINTGGGCGSVSGFWLWKEIMDLKDNLFLNQYEEVIPDASGYFDTLPLLKRGMRADGKLQNIDGFICLPYDYFHPIDYITGKKQISANTFGIHYFDWSWANDVMRGGNPKEYDYYSISFKRAEKIEGL